ALGAGRLFGCRRRLAFSVLPLLAALAFAAAFLAPCIRRFLLRGGFDPGRRWRCGSFFRDSRFFAPGRPRRLAFSCLALSTAAIAFAATLFARSRSVFPSGGGGFLLGGAGSLFLGSAGSFFCGSAGGFLLGGAGRLLLLSSAGS